VRSVAAVCPALVTVVKVPRVLACEVDMVVPIAQDGGTEAQRGEETGLALTHKTWQRATPLS
jgi:hypothetical protein